jgi:hypothetical protein
LSGDDRCCTGRRQASPLLGFAAAILAGAVIGTAMARVRWFDILFEPIFSFGYPIPKIAFYPIFIFVFGLGDMSKIALVFLECVYPITVQTYFGMRGAERVLVRAARARDISSPTNRLPTNMPGRWRPSWSSASSASASIGCWCCCGAGSSIGRRRRTPFPAPPIGRNLPGKGEEACTGSWPLRR